MTAGPMSRRNLRSAVLRKSRLGRHENPCRWRNGSCSRNCAALPSRTPQARATTGRDSSGASRTADAMIDRFSSTGAAAGAMK